MSGEITASCKAFGARATGESFRCLTLWSGTIHILLLYLLVMRCDIHQIVLHHLSILRRLGKSRIIHDALILGQDLLLMHAWWRLRVHSISCVIVHICSGGHLLLSQLSVSCSCISGIQHVVDLHSFLVGSRLERRVRRHLWESAVDSGFKLLCSRGRQPWFCSQRKSEVAASEEHIGPSEVDAAGDCRRIYCASRGRASSDVQGHESRLEALAIHAKLVDSRRKGNPGKLTLLAALCCLDAQNRVLDE